MWKTWFMITIASLESCSLLIFLSFNMTWQQLKLLTPAMQGLLCNFLLCANTTGLWIVSRGCHFPPNYGEIAKLRLKTSTLQSCMDQSCTEVIWKMFPGPVGLYLLVVSNGAAIHFQHVSRPDGLAPTPAPVTQHRALMARCCWVARICPPLPPWPQPATSEVSLRGFFVYREHLMHA